MKVIQESWDKPKFFDDINPSYVTLMGSRAYGTEREDSDCDFYGFIVPPIEIVFPHTKGVMNGFGLRHTPFEQYEAQHKQHPVYGEVDVTIYNIVKYCQLVMGGNPNMVDSIFTPDNCVVELDGVGKHLRNNRKLFLSEIMFHRFRGMAFQHASRLKKGIAKEGRKKNVDEFGWDVKDGYHTIRILLQIIEILETGDLVLDRNRMYLNQIRDGEYSLNYILLQFDILMKRLEEIVAKGSSVPYSPDEKMIYKVLVECLEMKYGNLSSIGFNRNEYK